MKNLQGNYREEKEEYTLDGTVDWDGRPAIKAKSGQWFAGTIILRKLMKKHTRRTCFPFLTKKNMFS